MRLCVKLTLVRKIIRVGSDDVENLVEFPSGVRSSSFVRDDDHFERNRLPFHSRAMCPPTQ